MRILRIGVLLISLVSVAFAAEDVVSSTHGTITKIDKAAKTIAIKTADGSEHVFHLGNDFAVHGVRASHLAAKDSWHGLK